LLSAGFSGCDIGRRPGPSASESLRLLASAPGVAQGLDCELDAGPTCGLAPTGALRFRFDRWLLPTTATSQSVSLVTAGTELGVAIHPIYDVATRTIEYPLSVPGGVAFELRLTDADEDPSGFGFRGFDGPALETKVTIPFRTALEAPPVGSAISQGAAPSCARVVTTLANAGCSRVGCHSRQTSPECSSSSPAMAWDESIRHCVHVPRMGLLLDDAQGLLATAINHVAHETQNGPDISRRVVSADRFGDQMPIIDPGRPENSYLIYKLVIGEQFNRELAERSDPSDPLSPRPMTRDEINRARDWFVRFGPMPPEGAGTPSGVSLYELYRVLFDWVRAGADCG